MPGGRRDERQNTNPDFVMYSALLVVNLQRTVLRYGGPEWPEEQEWLEEPEWPEEPEGPKEQEGPKEPED